MTPEALPPRKAAASWSIILREDPQDREIRARFDAWLAADPAHAEAWSSIGQTLSIIARTPEPFRSPEEDVPATDARRRGYPLFRARPVASVAMALAASLLLMLATPAFLLHFRADHITAAGQTRSVVLADGSKVQLGPDSALAVDYRDGKRDVRLISGEAWFDVRHDANRPFVVRSGDISTTVLGTGFDVRYRRDSTSVWVGRGRVRVADDRRPSNEAVELTTGRWVIMTASSIKAGDEPLSSIGAWRTGDVVATNRSVEDVIEEIRPWYQGRILLLDHKLGKRRVTGVFRGSDPAYALSVLTSPYGGRVRRVTPWLLIVTGS